MRSRFLVLSAVLATVTLGALAQERIKPKAAGDYDSVYAAINEHWKAGHWGKCHASARELLALISKRRGVEIRKAMPVPAGLVADPVAEADPQAAAMMAAFSASVGNVIEQTWRGGDKEVRVTVTTDSPMLQMFRMIVQNPAMLQPNQELVKYAECQAVLETDGGQVTLRFLLDESLVEGNFQGYDADGALKVFDQSAVTKLYAAITN